MFASALGKKSRRCDCAFDMGQPKMTIYFFFGKHQRMNETQSSLLSRIGYQKKARAVRCCVNSFFKVDSVCFSSFQFQVVLNCKENGLEFF